MIPIFYNTPAFSGYYPQFPYIFSYNQVMPPFYSPPINQGITKNIDKNVDPNSSQSNNSPNSSIKSPKIFKKKIRKVDNEYKVKDQNAQRNIISNIAHHMMSFIRKQCFTKQIVERIIKNHNINKTSEEFFVTFRKIKLRNYVRKITLQQLWENNHDPNFTKIFRILSLYFLSDKCFSSILFSRKIKNGLKYHHLPKIRQLISVLRRTKQHK